MIIMGNEGKKLVRFQYKRMPEFRYLYGLLDHQELDCPKAILCPKPSYSQLRSTSSGGSDSSQVPDSQASSLTRKSSTLSGKDIIPSLVNSRRKLAVIEENQEEVNSSIDFWDGDRPDLNEESKCLMRFQIKEDYVQQIVISATQHDYGVFGQPISVTDKDNNTESTLIPQWACIPSRHSFGIHSGPMNAPKPDLKANLSGGAVLMDIPVRFDLGSGGSIRKK
ncbi:hypothetical protein PTKIN_Ptkin04bG0102600 [Pterospermum kingtungense]